MRTLLGPLAALVEGLPACFSTRFYHVLLDALFSGLSLYLAFQLRFDGRVPADHLPVMWAWLLLLPVLGPAMIWALTGYRAMWRYFSSRDAFALAASLLPITAVMLVMRYFLQSYFCVGHIPAGVIVIQYGSLVGMAGGIRVLRRLSFETTSGSAQSRIRAVLVGTESTLPAAVRHLGGYPQVEVIGLLAPEPKLHNRRIGGNWVMDEPGALGRILAAHRLDLVLIADAGLESVGKIVETATEFGVDVRLLPSAANVVRGDVRISANPRPELALNLRASAPRAPHSSVVQAFGRRVVLITGAGGSIGAEISRQVARLPVHAALLLDRDENSIFELSRELNSLGLLSNLVPLIADIRDAAHMRQIFEQYRPRVVLHAAAYKHVPVMEQNPSEAVLNNVLGTRKVVDYAIEFGAERFVMISTDKAIRPESVMGASKRLAEMVVQQSAAACGKRFSCACVRFGNVVGSRGSVAPIFLRQIAAGGPVTITDEAMTRYFMTISEAVQLVLQAASLGSNGDIYIFDMGDPVKISDLARRLIEMSGLRPGKDIEVRIVGRRPGEKIHEQLWSDDARGSPTEFPGVFRVPAQPVPGDFASRMKILEEAALAHQESAVMRCLESMPIDFQTPSVGAAAGRTSG